MTYGLGRVEILSAQANGVTLLVLAGFILYEAISRLDLPAARARRPDPRGRAVGVRSTSRRRGRWPGRPRVPQRRGSFQHILTDLYAFIATAIAAGVILATGFERADPIASLLIAALMLRSAYSLLNGLRARVP